VASGQSALHASFVRSLRDPAFGARKLLAIFSFFTPHELLFSKPFHLFIENKTTKHVAALNSLRCNLVLTYKKIPSSLMNFMSAHLRAYKKGGYYKDNLRKIGKGAH